MKSLACALLAVLLLATLSSAEEAPTPTDVHAARQGRTFDGGITSGIATAISSLGTIGVLGLILIGLLLLPTALALFTAGNNFGMGKGRSAADGYPFHVNNELVMERMAMLQQVWEKFDVRDSRCRQRLICEVHGMEKELGPSARKIMKFIDYVGASNTSYLPQFLQNVLKEYVDAARHGKQGRLCHQFDGCPYSFADQLKGQRSLPLSQ